MYGGFLCGILSLICELAKGFIPVYLGQKCLDINSLLFVPVLVAPVFGHAFPFLQKQKGGKAITVSFGVLLGLFPDKNSLNPDWLLHNSRDCDIQTPDKTQ